MIPPFLISLVGGLVPNALRSAGTAAIKAGMGELTKTIGISTKPMDNKKTAIVAFVNAVIMLLDYQYGIKVAREWNEAIVTGLWVVTAMFAVSKPRPVTEVEK